MDNCAEPLLSIHAPDARAQMRAFSHNELIELFETFFLNNQSSHMQAPDALHIVAICLQGPCNCIAKTS